MNATSQYFELAQLEAQVMNAAAELAALSNDEYIIALNGNWIKCIYVGRGTETFDLTLSDKYTVNNRVSHAQDNLKRLIEIKCDLLEGN
ncbi:hypothetical protein F972_01507 [Acinetobacter sp. CIP 102529]|uniref:hypothetical protein n=1 Tax=Acinetobacter sp. CIP 102529 TaxID=1144668 RepID=UPI0002D111AA|nr:hypothetical protein [Acinetobacter sp. CIP 102529]ENU89146.1 hypothetical protein F972_01507 [Acinetobacter sp. CIP 102529]